MNSEVKSVGINCFIDLLAWQITAAKAKEMFSGLEGFAKSQLHHRNEHK
jgi:hypothetical protein